MHQINPDRRLKTLGLWLHGLGALTAIVVALLMQFLVFGPIDKQAESCARQTGRLQSILHDGREIRAQHTRLSNELAIEQEQATTLQARIPDEPRESDFLAQASQLADEVGLRIQDYRPGAVRSEQSYSTMRVDLICTGEYASICNFLDRLSRLPRHSSVVQLQIDSQEKQVDYSTRISLTLYFGVNSRPGVRKKGNANV